MHLKKMIETICREKNITQEELAKRVGVPPKRITFWKLGQQKPHKKNYEKLKNLYEQACNYSLF